MPFSSFNLPSIGLALLQAGARAQGETCDVHYCNLLLLKRIGLDLYQRIAEGLPTTALVGEWLFAEALFGQDSGRDRRFEIEILQPLLGKTFDADFAADLYSIRAAIPPFLEECCDQIDWKQYDLVGFTSLFQQHIASLSLAQALKKRFPHLLIALGGANCEDEMGIETHRQFPFVDYVCMGEGDISFMSLLKSIRTGEVTLSIAGVVRRENGDTVIPTPRGSPVRDLNILPRARYDEYLTQVARIGIDPTQMTIPFESSRGCWWGAIRHCTFCGLNGATMAYRTKSQRLALEELISLGRDFGRRMLWVDNIFDLKYFDEFFPELINLQAGFSFFIESKVNLKKSQVRILRRAGVSVIQPGIESLSTRVLKLMRKGCTFLQNVQTLKWCKEVDLRVAWNILYAFPGEQSEDYESVVRAIPLLAHLGPPMGASSIRLDRFSPYFTSPGDFGIEGIRANSAYSFIYPFESSVVERLAYYFEYHFEFDARLLMMHGEVDALVCEWRRVHSLAHLSYINSGNAVTIVDTRFAARSIYKLTGLQRLIFLECDEIRTMTQLETTIQDFEADGADNVMSTGDLLEGLEALEALGLLMREGRSFLSLATECVSTDASALHRLLSDQIVAQELAIP